MTPVRTFASIILSLSIFLVTAAGYAQPATPAGAAAPAEVRTIEVNGHGEARATPDLALLDIAIETHGGSAEDAASQNAELSQKVVKALRAKLGDKGKIWTGGYNLFPEYSQEPGQNKPHLNGYRAENSISIETGALDQIGALIDAAIAAGANRINSLNFGLREDTAARADAIGKATKDAQAQATALSNALGLKLKRIIRASTVSEVRPLPLMARGANYMAAEAPTPVQPGEVRVPATVSISYEIE